MKIRKALFLIGLTILFLSSTNAQISPGDLCNAHAHLEGISNCTKCHNVGNNKVTREKCLDCHTQIKENIRNKKGYHASKEAIRQECSACHNDHHGRNFQIIRLNKKLFNHDLAGFSLKGKHAKIDCNSCHKSAFIKDPILKKKAGTYLGLDQNCLSCHEDYHQGKLSANCSGCHNFDSFKNATGFDHSKTKFPLLGQHKKVDCIKCHKTEIINGKKFQNFSGLKFANCTNCHDDVHKNKFGQNCKQCHTEESFHFNLGMKAFNHDKTNFKLIGKHKLVDCKECHKTNMTAPLKHRYCTDCHSDYHKGEFSVKGKPINCNDCHDNNGFTPSTFTIERHNKTFVLDGAHEATLCSACHKKQGKWTFKKIGTKCIDCHGNEHEGFLDEKFMPNDDCTTCHTTKDWHSVKFDHNRTHYKLEGQHAVIACSKCHYAKDSSGRRTQQFEGVSKDCSSCHKDSHAGQFAVNGKTDCSRCHGFDSWTLSRFDHDTARFKLDGAHANVGCDECHKPVMNSMGKYIQYKFDDISCASCHK